MEEEKTSVDQVTSTQKTLSSSHDPGWNDPPKWAFSPSPGAGAVPTKRMLNKRVAFPLNSGSPGTSLNNNQAPPGLPSSLPPPVQSSPLTSAPHRPLSIPSGKTESPCSTIIAFDKDQALIETVENFDAVMSQELEFSNKIEEVQRRLDVLKVMWKEDKLKEEICDKVLKISQALKNNDAEAADKIHVSLVMENAAVCNTWISGIRHMILELREKSSQRDTAVLLNSTAYLLPKAEKGEEAL
ncbi:steroid receptor RNA activator 1-like isoform X2 [Venturia canescens]|uniref:steroid receptor RNA activator 1-like isoform X2 n=1 Tax=Venturia canescens TaxID=32260 RepID=UPI001C9D0111|nr:steroid receptor RNA activator 1-like isoform X2 [Venturia canescens]